MIRADVAIIGGGLGSVAAALALLERGRRVVLTEEYAWLGGQLTSQAVPPDEHIWVEQFGVTARYRALRDGIRRYYRDHYPLTAAARADRRAQPGRGRVSKLCHEPRVALAVITSMLDPYRASGRLTVLTPAVPVAAEVTDGVVRTVTVVDPRTGVETVVAAEFVLDGTETGDLLPLTGTEYVVGAESRARDRRAERAGGGRSGQRAVDRLVLRHRSRRRRPHHRHARPTTTSGDRSSCPSGVRRCCRSSRPIRAPGPRRSGRWSSTRPPTRRGDPRFDAGDRDLWQFRRIAARHNFVDGFYDSDIVLANWPQLDYVGGSIIDTPDRDLHLAAAKAQSRAYVHWLQTEAPRPDGGRGWPGLRLRGDVVGTADGFAQAPYIRESRRIQALTTVREQDVSHQGARLRRPGPLRGVGRDRHVPDRPASLHRRRQLHRRRVRTVPDPARRAGAASGRRTCCRRRRTSAPPTSPTGRTGCIRSSGTSASPPVSWRPSAWSAG